MSQIHDFPRHFHIFFFLRLSFSTMADLLWDVDLYDNRTTLEKFLLMYPRTWSDFDDAEANGLFVPRWHHGIYAVLWAVALTLLRSGFNRFQI